MFWIFISFLNIFHNLNLAAVVKAFGPRDRDALDVHNDIVKTRSKIVEKDRQIKDFDAKMEEILKRAGNVKFFKLFFTLFLSSFKFFKIVVILVKDKCGFTQKQIQDIVKLQQDLIAKQEEINLQKNAITSTLEASPL